MHPTMVRDELEALTSSQRTAFEEEYDRRARSRLWAWVAWFFGWHYAYVNGRWGLNIFYFFLGIPMTLGVWWLVEAFRLPRRVRNRNADMAIAAMRDLKAVTG